MKIVLDTNVLVSGIFFSGVPGKILDRWNLGECQLCVSAEILEEYDRISKKMALKFGNVEYERVLDLIHRQAIVVPDTELRERVCTDPKDDKFLACAIESKALLVVSGDTALLKTSGYREVNVIKPAPFMVLLEKNQMKDKGLYP